MASAHGGKTGAGTTVRKAAEMETPWTVATQKGSFRVWYEINEEQKKVTLRAILHKDEAKKYY